MTERLHLSSRHRTVLVSLLQEHLPGVEAWAYGSRVNGRSHDGSDLDLVLRGPGLTEIPTGQLADFEEAVGESSIPFLVEARDWARLPERFHGEIERNYVVLDAGKPDTTHIAEGTGGGTMEQLPQTCGSPSMAGEWRESTWGEEIALEYGKALRGHDKSAGTVRVFGSNGPIGWTDEPLASGPGVILGRKGAYRGVEYSPDSFFVIDTAYYVVTKADHDMRWLYYAVKHYKLGEIDDGSPIPSTTRAAVYPQELVVPPLPEQRAIAHILGTLDDKIEVNRRMNATLEALARAIFKDWFVDFGPTRAKMEGREPYLAPDIWDLFPDKIDDEGKPVGWPLGSLQDLLVLQRGFDLPKSQRASGTYPIIAASGVHGTHSDSKVSGPGVVTGRSGVIGNVFYIHDDFWPLNTSLWVKEFPNSSPVHAYFLIQTLDFASFNAGSAVPTLNRNHVHGLPMPIPPKGFVQAFDEIALPLMRRQRQNEQENIALTQTRDLLLPKLMSGKIRLRDASKSVEGLGDV